MAVSSNLPDDQSDESSPKKALEVLQALIALNEFSPAEFIEVNKSLLDPNIPKHELPSISSELQELIWCFVDGVLTSDEEARLGELAVQEPAARLHLARYLELLRRSEDSEFDDDEDESETPVQPREKIVPVAIRSSRFVISPGSDAWNTLPGISLRLSPDELKVTRRSGLDFIPSYGLARGKEPSSLVEVEDVQPDARLQLRVEQRSDGTCDLMVDVTPAAHEFARQQLTAELVSIEGVLLQSAPVVDGIVEFTSLQPGTSLMVIFGDDREVIRYVIEIAKDS